MRTRVKICGITSVEDALVAIQCGCDAIGLVFYAPSPRCVTAEVAANIVAAIQPFVSVVGLFVDASYQEVKSVLAQVRLDILQFHGNETPEDCRRYGLPYMKAIRVKNDINLVQCELNYNDAKALLLDAFVEDMPGGTGQVFDWDLIPPTLNKPIVLAGGLNENNVSHAIAKVRPYAIDVSGGVEKSKGIKDVAKIAALMKNIS